jgi:hypothetical protein
MSCKEYKTYISHIISVVFNFIGDDQSIWVDRVWPNYLYSFSSTGHIYTPMVNIVRNI